MEKALQMLRDSGYDAFIEYGHLYYRPPEGGVVAVLNEAHVKALQKQGLTNKDIIDLHKEGN